MRCAVVGSGPAGAAAAITLAGRGHTVVVCERGAPGKDKACGDAYLPDAVELLARLGLTAERIGVPVAGRFDTVELFEGDRRIWEAEVGAGTGFVAPRAVVDQQLRDIVSGWCAIRYGATVRAIDRADGRWELRGPDGSDRAGFDGVIIASGAAPALTAGVGLSSSADVCRSVSCYAEGPVPAALRFVFGCTPFAGYGWVFPLEVGRANVGVCALSHRSPDVRATLRAFLRDSGFVPVGRPRAGAGPAWSGRCGRWHRDEGLLTCGDAAGLVDPLTGEGIGPALESGVEAGSAMSDFFDGGRARQPLDRYSRWIDTTFSKRYGRDPVRQVWEHLVAGATPTIVPRDGSTCLPARGSEAAGVDDAPEEGLGAVLVRVADELVGRTRLEDPALVQEADRIERRGDLVEQHQLGVHRQGPADRQPLLFSPESRSG